MYQVRQMRLLRQKHKIPLEELANAAKVSVQRISQIELSTHSATSYQSDLIREAFFIVAYDRKDKGKNLLKDLNRLENTLLDFTGEYDI